MRLQQQWWSGLVAAVLGGLMGVTGLAAAGDQFIPVLVTREGALRSVQIPFANGVIDYVTLLNERDGGIHGVKLVWEECETVYDVPRGVECYERLKAKGPTGAAAFLLANAPLVYALIERATHDRIPLLSPGTGRADAADGRVFPYVFNPPANFWSLNTAKLRFIGQRVGGVDKLKGLKIAHVYLDNDYGRETYPHARPSGRPLRLYGAAPGGAMAGAGPEGDLAARQGRPARLGHLAEHRRRHALDGPEGSGPGRLPP